MRRSRVAVAIVVAFLLGLALWARPVYQAAAGTAITFSVPSVVDPIHTNGEPDIAIEPTSAAHIFVSGPTGTGTQRSTWYNSSDGGHTYRVISPNAPPTAVQSIEDPPGGGDTDIAFDHTGKQYFADLYALVCLRVATTTNEGATVNQNIYPGGCTNDTVPTPGVPGSDRQWYAVFDPALTHVNSTSPYVRAGGHTPLIYLEYNNLVNGAQWSKSTDGLNFTNATNGGSATSGYAPFGADGYPQIDQVTGKVFQAAGMGSGLYLNIGSPDAHGNLTFLDAPTAAHPDGNPNALVRIAGVPAGASPDTLFTVLSMDSARNLFVAWTNNNPSVPSEDQTWVSVSTAASGWRKWAPAVRVSSAPSMVSVFPWIKAGGPGRADVVWYGANKQVDPSAQDNQVWNVFMSQVVYPTSSAGAVAGYTPTVTQVKVTPHPMHYNDVCLDGSGCITSQGNRNLADFFQVNIDHSGAAEIVYDDTSNGLAQPGFTPTGNQTVDHAGAPVVTVIHQASGPGLYNAYANGSMNTPISGLSDPAGDARYPVIGGANVPGMDILRSGLSLSGSTLTVTMKVVNLANPAAVLTQVPGSAFVQYVTRWQMGNTIYYAAMENTAANRPMFYAGRAQSVDLCSVSACFPHVLTYPEPSFPGGTAQPGSVTCPTTPSIQNPCTLAIKVNTAAVGNPTTSSLLEEVGSYALVSSHLQGSTTNAQAQADNVPLEIDGACCYNFK